jgi:uncharacterized protein DUF3592
MGWFFLACFVCLLAYAGVQFYRYRGSNSWPTLEGVIEGHPEVRAWGGDGKSYYAILLYSYSVDGESYSGTWESPSGIKKQQLLDTITAKLPSGSKLRIRYNPRKPQMSMADIDISMFSVDLITTLGL